MLSHRFPVNSQPQLYPCEAPARVLICEDTAKGSRDPGWGTKLETAPWSTREYRPIPGVAGECTKTPGRSSLRPNNGTVSGQFKFREGEHVPHVATHTGCRQLHFRLNRHAGIGAGNRSNSRHDRRIDGPVYVVKNRDGAELKLTVTDNPLFVAIVPSKMADIKPGMFVGSAGMMQPDGVQKAIEVHIFPESMRGTGEGHYDWDLLPKSKMTNANVEHAVNSVDGQILSVKYKDGEKKLLVTPETIVVTYEFGKREEVQPGTKIFVSAAKKQPDGTVQTPRITYGRNGQGPAF